MCGDRGRLVAAWRWEGGGGKQGASPGVMGVVQQWTHLSNLSDRILQTPAACSRSTIYIIDMGTLRVKGRTL